MLIFLYVDGISEYLDDPGSEEITEEIVESMNPPPLGTQQPPAALHQSIKDTSESLEQAKDQVQEIESVMQESVDGPRTEPEDLVPSHMESVIQESVDSVEEEPAGQIPGSDGVYSDQAPIV